MKINLVFKDFNSLVGTVPRALASGSGPDVTEGNQGYQTDAQLVKAKLIIPLTKYVKKYGWDKLYAPSTWGMFRWTPDGKSFGKGPVWGLAQTGQNVVVFYNKKKLQPGGPEPEHVAEDVRGVRGDARHAAGEAAVERPGDRGGEQGGLRLHPPLRRHLGREREARGRSATGSTTSPARATTRRARSRRSARLQQWAKNGLLQRRLQRRRVRRVGRRSSRRARARCGSAATGTRRSSRRVSAPQNVGVMPIPPGPSGQWASIGGLSGPWHISSKTKNADLGAEWLNYVITSTQAKKLMFGQQQLPADRSAKPPTGDPYLTQVYNAFTKVANDDGLLLYTDWASPSMYTTLQNQFQLLLAGRTTPQAMAKAVQDDWAKFDKTLR